MFDLREIKEFLKDSMGYIIVIIAVFLLFLYVVALHQVAGDSMIPNLNDGDVLLLSKIRYKITNPKRFDIVVIQTDSGETYVKRIIGLPGEKVKHINSILYINDEMVSEDFLSEDTYTSNFTLTDICKENECVDNIIPEEKYLVLGDNRDVSIDSRELGLITKDNIIGKSLFRLWPLF